jgi:hypothetical protein
MHDPFYPIVLATLVIAGLIDVIMYRRVRRRKARHHTSCIKPVRIEQKIIEGKPWIVRVGKRMYLSTLYPELKVTPDPKIARRFATVDEALCYVASWIAGDTHRGLVSPLIRQFKPITLEGVCDVD